MDTKEVIEKKEPYIEISYLFAKSEKFPKEEFYCKVVIPLKSDIPDAEIKDEVMNRLKVVKEAVQKNI